MKMKTKLACSLVLLSNMAASAISASYTHDCTVAEEFRMRDGLPDFFTKIQSEKEVRIAYLGGSITEANGWRVKTMAWLKQQFPKARFTEINAAISGTGSDFSACRLKDDVLVKKPDLVFLECRVNGGGGFERESVEGIVRHIWRDNPQTDICFIYTISLPMLEDMQAGRPTGFGKTMETIANRYGIPSIDLGVEIAKLEQEGKLTFKAAEPENGKILFTKDGNHPGDEGHQIYCEIIARSLLKMKDKANLIKHEPGEPLDPSCWETASLLPVAEAELSAGWVPVDEEDINYNTKRTRDMLRKAVKCNQIGETITVKWNGTTVGFSDIPCGDTAVIEAVIDGKPPIIMERKQTQKPRKLARFWYLPAQSPGEHEVRYTVKQLPEEGSFYAGQLLIVGTPIKR